MSFNKSFRQASVCVLVAAILFCGVSMQAIADPEIDVRVGNVEGELGETGVLLPIYISNYLDSIASVGLFLQMDRPNVASFMESFDTTGTLVGGWDWIGVDLYSGTGHDIKIMGAAGGLPGGSRGIGPQSGEIPFINLRLAMPDVPDLFEDSANILVSTFVSMFSIGTPDGRTLGVSYEEVWDSTCFRCESWVPPESTVCLSWQQVSAPPYDSCDVQMNSIPFIDTDKVRVVSGSVATTPPVLGNIDASLDGLVTMADLTMMIDHLFISLQPLRWPTSGNIDCSSDDQVTMGDLTVMIDHLFISLDELDCPLKQNEGAALQD